MDGIKYAVFTDKSIRLLGKNQYTSNVESGSTRTEIKHWVELFFGVKVIAMNSHRLPGKSRRMGPIMGHTMHYRRMIITLQPDSQVKSNPRNNLIYGQRRCGKGRNARGIITARHRGHKRLYRKIDFRRNEKRYMRAIIGDTIVSGTEVPIKMGNALPLSALEGKHGHYLAKGTKALKERRNENSRIAEPPKKSPKGLILFCSNVLIQKERIKLAVKRSVGGRFSRSTAHLCCPMIQNTMMLKDRAKR
ncbi:hypothetical protein H5410_027517 [Solanum commersonii]|uniref:Large ribosomal subunit protein uL23cz/uL23cy n=1 Tax=Solanum commersonii TaxID=4109 RepID=A0A9J5YZE5_SOLCO|nr:hypothetical protein H5410_027517 [Solanum commersonii]